MFSKDKIVEEEIVSCKANFDEQENWKDVSPKSRQIRKQISAHVEKILSSLKNQELNTPFAAVEKQLIAQVFALGRLFLAFFLSLRQERSSPIIRSLRKQAFQKRRPQPRMLGTFFGKVRYWRTYMKKSTGNGLYPLDLSLGLTTDGFSLTVLSMAAKLVTLISFDRVTEILSEFLLWSPSKTSVEHTVLGLGHYTTPWFASAPPPEADGEVLIIQIDSKAIPTATEAELEKRRVKRGSRPPHASPRHRGRDNRARRGSKRRRKKGDKSKNGKAATLVVMYTLARDWNPDGVFFLRGPINKKIYGSFHSKRNAFAFARKQADKRGFWNGSGKTIQIITDGDLDFEEYVKDLFPKAIHTLDVIHVIERLWSAGECFIDEGSSALKQWMEDMKELVYKGKIAKVIQELEGRLAKIPKTGPGNKGRRTRMEDNLEFLKNRTSMLNYGWLAKKDLELSSGAVEGAVRHVVGERFDCGGMRWIKERAESLLHLRCIMINGEWEKFIEFVHDQLTKKAKQELQCQKLLTRRAAPLLGFAEAA